MRPCWWTIRALCRRRAKAIRGITFPSMKRSGMDCAPLTEELRETDRISLWEFDHTCNPVDRGLAASPGAFAQAIEKLTPPCGGTEIGGAIDRVFAETDPGDVLLITDGKSYALDVHRLAQEGRRIFVVLVGEDSLEANVGHLAALTGGDIHFSFGADVDTALHAALQGMRTKRMAREARNRLPEGGFPNRYARSGAMSA